jgi:hypothetical protein
MGNYDSDAEIEITDDQGNLVTSPEDRERYKMEGRYRKSFAELSIFKGGYSALTNNCIHFTRRYIFEQILTRTEELKNLGTNIQWIVAKWREMGCKRSPIELAKFLSGIFCINPLTITPERGAKLVSNRAGVSTTRTNTLVGIYSSSNCSVSFSTVRITLPSIRSSSTIPRLRTRLSKKCRMRLWATMANRRRLLRSFRLLAKERAPRISRRI